MKVEQLELINFRNYDKKKFHNFNDINIIVGPNGSGKTSIIEAIYYLSIARSFRTSDDMNLINSNKKYLKIKGIINNTIKKITLECSIDNKEKKFKVNNSLKHKISDYIFKFKVVLFSSNDLNFIRLFPSVRRNYINISIAQINKGYLKLLNDYNRVLKSKNDYIKKSSNKFNYDQIYLDVLDKKLSEIGSEICRLRKDFTDKINKYLSKFYSKFNSEKIILEYLSNVSSDNLNYYEKLKRNRKKDIDIGFTQLGIHRDDFELVCNERNIKDYFSQGNQKLAMLSYKIAELKILKKDYYEEPILLLDDLFSEFDSINQNKVLKFLIKDLQIFITTTDIKNINKEIIKKAKIIDLGGNKNE